MKEVLIIGSGISGLSCAIRCAEHGVHAVLVSPRPSERAQSVMAAGGINAVTSDPEEGDSVACHIEDTLKSGASISGRSAVTGLCSNAEEILMWLERKGTVFSVDEKGSPARRAFGGQTYKRTHYCGSSTGKQIVSALIMEARRFEIEGLIERRMRMDFHSALIADGICYGALLYNEITDRLEPVFADAVVMATGGQNALFGKTIGSVSCDGYAAGRLFTQGAVLKNLEFIQYHPTTIETPQKRMLISEAVRGEGGRLFYEEEGRRVYFMEDKYGPRGNLMTRDVVSQEIYASGRDVFLDISFLDKAVIDSRLPEVRDLCIKYRGIDITKEPIPVAPFVHFFMGGLAVHLNHETNIRDLYAVGECASMYHGANRLGGNSLLAAIYSGRTAADDISGRREKDGHPSFEAETVREQKKTDDMCSREGTVSVTQIRNTLADIMHNYMGIVRSEDQLKKGIAEVEDLHSAASCIGRGSSYYAYPLYSLSGILTLARAVITCAEARRESRGSHCRSDHPGTSDEYAYASLITYDDGAYSVRYDLEKKYEN